MWGLFTDCYSNTTQIFTSKCSVMSIMIIYQLLTNHYLISKCWCYFWYLKYYCFCKMLLANFKQGFKTFCTLGSVFCKCLQKVWFFLFKNKYMIWKRLVTITIEHYWKYFIFESKLFFINHLDTSILQLWLFFTVYVRQLKRLNILLKPLL